MRHRLQLTACPLTGRCRAFMVLGESHDPGLWLLVHVRDAHPELVLTQTERAEQDQARWREWLAASVGSRRN